MGQYLAGTFDALRVTAHLRPNVVFGESLDASRDYLRHEPLPQAVPSIRTAVGLHIGVASPGGEQCQPVDFCTGTLGEFNGGAKLVTPLKHHTTPGVPPENSIALM